MRIMHSSRHFIFVACFHKMRDLPTTSGRVKMDTLLRESGATWMIKNNQIKKHAPKKMKLASLVCAGILLMACGVRRKRETRPFPRQIQRQ